MEKRRISLFWPLLFIAVGVILFLNNIGAISGSSWEVLFKLWPLILIAAGLDAVWRREGYVGSTVVIGLGVVFLLGNFGRLQFGSWEMILRLWPILLVALGLDLLIGQRKPWSAVAGVLVGVLATAGIVWLVLASPLSVPLRSEEVTFPQEVIKPAESAAGSITVPVGRLSIGSGANPNYLLEGKASLAGDQEVTKGYDKDADPVTFELSLKGISNLTPFTGSAERQAWELMLNDQVSYDLEMKTAVGEQQVDMSKLNFTRLVMHMAVGKQVITLPASGAFKVEVRNALGEVIIHVPRGTALQLRVDKALTALDVPSDYTRSGSMITSPGAEAAAAGEVSIHNAIGHISVQYLP